MGTAVYRWYDEHGTLLYVGITSHLMRRTHDHAKEKPWWSSVARSEVEHYETREQALTREAELIRSLRPVHNVMLNRGNPARTEYMQARHWEGIARARERVREAIDQADAFSDCCEQCDAIVPAFRFRVLADDAVSTWHRCACGYRWRCAYWSISWVLNALEVVA